MEEGRVAVAGSIMLDMVMRVPRRPHPGETVFAEDFGMYLGGKGFNQAVAARRMGARVDLIGRIGADDFAGRFREAFATEGIDAGGVSVDAEAGTGVAMPLVEPDGTNTIVAAPRANLRLTPAHVEQQAVRFEQATVTLLQLEVPVDAVLAAARLARANDRMIVLNPAPSVPVPDELLRLADVLTPNEVEAAVLAGLSPLRGVDDAFTAAEQIQARGARCVVVTLGAMGCVVADGEEQRHLPAHLVRAVDSTAAGDAFSGALAARLAAGDDLLTALRWANAAGALATTRLGAEPSLPRYAEVARLLGEQAPG